MIVALVLIVVHACTDSTAEAILQDAEQKVILPILGHPLRGEDCHVTITQRGAGQWSPEKCAKGSEARYNR